MLSLEEAQARLLDAARPLAPIDLTLDRAAGRRIAADLVARRTQPPFDASAMDGYAIRFDDMPGPWRLIGESAAGSRFDGAIGLGQAVRIFTGALMPPGADSVLLQEDAERSGDLVTLSGSGPETHGRHVRRAGLDFAAGDVLLRGGERLTPARLALAAAGGYGTVAVHPRPTVALLSTGSELVPPGAVPGPDQIVSSNGVMLGALIDAAGGAAVDRGIARDDLDALAAAITGARDADILVTIGGASVGDHDLVVPALKRCGAEIDFWKVALRPGKPVMVGRLGRTHVIGLPGNPVSAFVCALLFVLPLVRRLAGDPRPLPRVRLARSAYALPANGTRRDFMRATSEWRDGERWVAPAATQDSSMLAVLARSDALVVRPPGAAPVAIGEQVGIITLDNVESDS